MQEPGAGIFGERGEVSDGLSVYLVREFRPGLRFFDVGISGTIYQDLSTLQDLREPGIVGDIEFGNSW
jgi:hypothetical protein